MGQDTLQREVPEHLTLSEAKLNSKPFSEVKKRLEECKVTVGRRFRFISVFDSEEPHTWKVCIDCEQDLHDRPTRPIHGASWLFIHDKCWTHRAEQRAAERYLSRR